MFAMKWKFLIYINFILTFKKTKSLYLQRKCLPQAAAILPELVLNPATGQEFAWCMLVHAQEELKSSIWIYLVSNSKVGGGGVGGEEKTRGLCYVLPFLFSPLAL